MDSNFGIPYYHVPTVSYGLGFPNKKGGLIPKSKNKTYIDRLIIEKKKIPDTFKNQKLIDWNANRRGVFNK